MFILVLWVIVFRFIDWKLLVRKREWVVVKIVVFVVLILLCGL